MTTDLDVIFSKALAGDPPPEEAGIFGIDLPKGLGQICLLGVPWDATTSYGNGTAKGPESILKASHQLDLFDNFFGPTFRFGIEYVILEDLLGLNNQTRGLVEKVLCAYDAGDPPDEQDIRQVNTNCGEMLAVIETKAEEIARLSQNKLLGLVGGDHSVSEALLKVLSKNQDFGVLHIDAHHDLRDAYEGFRHSHASVFYNALQNDYISCLISVGIRDFSFNERELAREDDRVTSFYDEDLFAMKSSGQSFGSISDEIIGALPDQVYISLDIDGLSPNYCPSTGTPVPGGLSFQEMVFLIHRLVESGRKVVGFDIVEVAPSTTGDEWDANVGARLLYKLCGALGQSSGLGFL